MIEFWPNLPPFLMFLLLVGGAIALNRKLGLDAERDHPYSRIGPTEAPYLDELSALELERRHLYC